MSPETLQIAVLIATGAVAVLVPLLILLLASRIRNAAHESTQAALTQAARHHEQVMAELTREHARSIAEYARQHQTALAELASEHKRIAQEFGMFSQKRHEVYARLYARYRRTIHDFAAALTGHEPEFQKFSRDDLLRYLQRRKIRERDAADAIAAMDRGDIFAMSKLMTRLHWRATLRDATTALEHAHGYEALNELYLSDAVVEAVGNVRRKVEALSFSLMREQDRGDQAARLAKHDEMQSAIGSLLHAMRDDLRSSTDARPRPRLEVAHSPPRGALPPPRAPLADKAAPAQH